MNELTFSERLLDAPPIILSGGYLFEAERRGYLTAGEFVPMVALEHPEVLKQITTDFLRAGSDIALAFTYNGHREKLKLLGQEHLLESLNRAAMSIAVEAAKEQRAAQSRDIYVAGNISNSNIFDPADESSKSAVRQMYREMIKWAKEEGADLIVGRDYVLLRRGEDCPRRNTARRAPLDNQCGDFRKRSAARWGLSAGCMQAAGGGRSRCGRN